MGKFQEIMYKLKQRYDNHVRVKNPSRTSEGDDGGFP